MGRRVGEWRRSWSGEGVGEGGKVGRLGIRGCLRGEEEEEGKKISEREMKRIDSNDAPNEGVGAREYRTNIQVGSSRSRREDRTASKRKPENVSASSWLSKRSSRVSLTPSPPSSNAQAHLPHLPEHTPTAFQKCSSYSDSPHPHASGS